VKLTLFSVEDANRMLGELRPALEQLQHAKREFDRLEREIDVLTLAAAGATAANRDALELRRAVGNRNRVGERVRQGIQAIHARGPLVKDLERGLVDFYSVAGDRLIFLCWQLGESEVSHWHTLKGGFANRQPLNRSERE
jgi:hypothetical protein